MHASWEADVVAMQNVCNHFGTHAVEPCRRRIACNTPHLSRAEATPNLVEATTDLAEFAWVLQSALPEFGRTRPQKCRIGPHMLEYTSKLVEHTPSWADTNLVLAHMAQGWPRPLRVWSKREARRPNFARIWWKPPKPYPTPSRPEPTGHKRHSRGNSS